MSSYHYSTPLKSNSYTHGSTPIQRPTPISGSRSSSATSSTASSSSPSCSPVTPMNRHLTPRRRIHLEPHANLMQEFVRLLTRSNKLLLGVASLLVTWLLTAPPYQRMALEKSKSYDLPEDYHGTWKEKKLHLRFQLGAPDVDLKPVTKPPPKPPKPHVQLKPQPFVPLKKMQVHFLADATTPDTTSKFILDGLERSDYLELTAISIAQLQATERQLATLQVFERNEDMPLLYIVDWGSMNRDCALLETLLHKTTIQYTSSLVLIDFSASTRHTQCAFLEDYKRVLHTKRSVVEKRFFDTTFQWVNPGQLLEEDSIQYAPLVLRESFVDLMHNVTLTTNSSPKRTMDLLFNWKPGDNSHYGFLRRIVADKVEQYGGNVTSFAGSDRGYVQAMLATKICVLAQRDEWEGHYRLLEAMASGAMVLSDPMLAMPAGFKNGTNLVVYRNLQELKHYIRYYLGKGSKKRQKIAQNGRNTVLGRHRSWHRMEEIVFGQPQTLVEEPNAEAPLKRERPELKLVEH